MITAVYDYIKENNLIEQGDIVITGVSGGADSVCLFRMLLEIREKIGFRIYAVHVEHGIRGEEAIRDMEFVEKLCRKYNIECSVYHYDVKKMAKERKLSVEEAGRMARYQAFSLEKQKRAGEASTKIAVAHHKNDNVETFLLHLVRGSGMEGLKAMELMRGEIIRPLLFLDRKEIEEYLEDISQDFCTDSTNLTDEYARNKIRLNVLPELEKINSKAVKNIHEATQKITMAQDYLTVMMEKEYKAILKKEQWGYALDIEGLKNVHEYMRSEVIKQALYECAGNRKNIGAIHINAVNKLLFMENGKEMALPYKIKAVRAYDVIQLKKEKKEEIKKEISVIINQSGQYNIPDTQEEFLVSLEENHKKNVNIKEKTYTKCFDYDKIENDLVIRNRKSGDYLVIDDLGHRQSLKAFFINEKIQKDLRGELLLLADGSHILWIVGYRISEAYKVSGDTKRILKIQRKGNGIYE